jgi:hypothetical protein
MLCAFAGATLRIYFPAKTPSCKGPTPPPNFFLSPYFDFSSLAHPSTARSGHASRLCARIVSSLFHPYVLIALAISSLPRSMRPATTENTIFIGIMMPLKARMGTVTSVPAK